MQFLNSILSLKTKQIRKDLSNHPFWESIEKGTLSKKKLALFVLQDYWLVSQADKIDTLLIASMQDNFLRKLLLERLAKRIRNTYSPLFDFGFSVGLAEKDFKNIEPLSGCMALTTYFYWMIDNTSDLEKIACIDASKEIFSNLCVKVQPALIKHYGLNKKQVNFFTVHKDVLENIQPVDKYIELNSKTLELKKKIDLGVRLSYEFEAMFYDTLLKE